MTCLRTLFVAAIAAVTLNAAARLAAEDTKSGECILNAFAAKLNFTEDQKSRIRNIHNDYERRAAPVCEQIWKSHIDHHQAVLQILTPEQKQMLPEVMKGERDKMLEQFATKLELTADQKKQAQRVCDESFAKFKDLAAVEEGKRAGKFQALKNEHFEAFCAILTDDQRVKLPALIQEEMQSGRTPSKKSEIRNAMAEKLNLTDDQKQRLDKVCDEFASKIDEQKATIRKMCKEKEVAIEKVLDENQKAKFKQYVKATTEE